MEEFPFIFSLNVSHSPCLSSKSFETLLGILIKNVPLTNLDFSHNDIQEKNSTKCLEILYMLLE